MKTTLLCLSVSIFALQVQASDIVCTTNLNGNPREASTTITISTDAAQPNVTLVTQGGMAHYMTAPLSYDVQAVSKSTELEDFVNSDAGFTLEVSTQSQNGQMAGTITSSGANEPTQIICHAAAAN